MYVIRYKLQLGENRHYSPSALAGIRFVRDIEAGGGQLLSIMRTSDGKLLTLAQLEEESSQEIGPDDQRRFTVVDTIRRLLDRRR